jgi:3-oxoacyl-[acyl-carrier-protein] synthase-3
MVRADYGVGILGLGKYLPKKSVSNQQVEEWTKLAPGYIEDRTGVKNRFVVEEGDTASGMSAEAAKQALEMAGVSAERLGLIIGCTFSPDYLTPAMACKVHGLLGAKAAFAYDLVANCTAFQIGAMAASDKMFSDPSIEHALVLGTAIQSRFINWSDANSAMYFGDGAGAAVLGRVPPGYGILANANFTNSAVYESVRIRGGGSTFPLRAANVDENLQYYEINGMEVWKQVVQYQPIVVKQVLEKIGKTTSDVDLFVFHQANLKLIEYLMGKMRLPMSRTFTNVAEIGNTGEASMVIALNDAVRKGLVKRDALVVLSGVGAGFTFGATAIRWY